MLKIINSISDHEQDRLVPKTQLKKKYYLSFVPLTQHYKYYWCPFSILTPVDSTFLTFCILVKI